MFKSAFAATLAATPLVAGAAFAEPYGPYVESQVTSIAQFSDRSEEHTSELQSH